MTAIHRETPNAGRVLGIAVDHNGTSAQHQRPQSGHRRHRRLDRQREFPPHVRSAPDRGILRPGRHAVVGPGRQRRTRRDGGRRVAVGTRQPDRRVRLRSHQARLDRLPIRLSSTCSWTPGSPVFDNARASGCACRNWQDVILGQHAGQALLRRDRPAVHLQQLSKHRSLRRRTAISTPRIIKYDPSNFINAALAGIGDGHNGGGPIWAIFDADAVDARELDSDNRRTSISTPASSLAPPASKNSRARS